MTTNSAQTDGITWTTTKHGDERIVLGFGIKDSKGRECGAVITCRYVAASTTPGVATHHAGEIEVEVHAARSGARFGALPRSIYVADMDAAKALGLEKAEDMAKRITKDAAKTDGIYLTAGERKALKT